jgi:hypothetical protein
MPNITLSVSKELKNEMERHSSVKWSSAVRSIIEQKIADFDESERIAKKSRFSWKSWKLIGTRISKSAAKHAEALLNESDS